MFAKKKRAFLYGVDVFNMVMLQPLQGGEGFFPGLVEFSFTSDPPKSRFWRSQWRAAFSRSHPHVDLKIYGNS